MWRVACALVVLLAVGCKNSTTGQYTNPFLTPDRVPPPSTRVLAPGTAQPYYPGDPAPALGAPVIGAPVPTSPTYPGATPPLTTPPGGWGGTTYQPQSSIPMGPTGSFAGLNGDAVSVPSDSQNLRFAQASPYINEPITPTPGGPTPDGTMSAPSFNAFAAAPPATMRMPIQSMLPLGGQSQGAPQQLQTREVTAAEYFAPVGSSSGAQQASAQLASDGFRPQGSVPRASAEEDNAFRPPAITRANVAIGSEGMQYATGENFELLRGQLEYWPETGAWSLRYLPGGAPADSLGGRVMIENPQVLANLPPGEFVTVRGQLFGQAADDGTMSAMYRVSGVQRQRQ